MKKKQEYCDKISIFYEDRYIYNELSVEIKEIYMYDLLIN